MWLGEEKERMAEARVAGEEPTYKVGKEDTKALKSSSRESLNYEMDCITCRLQGRVRRYYGESSRSLHRRGKEHLAEIEGGAVSHPLVAHFWVEHGGRRQPVLIRGTGFYKTATESQVAESVKIDKVMGKPEKLLNQRSEWAGSKLPGIMVRVPVGVGKYREREEEEGVVTLEEREEKERKARAMERWMEAQRKGTKRLQYMRDEKEGEPVEKEEVQERPRKRRRGGERGRKSLINEGGKEEESVQAEEREVQKDSGGKVGMEGRKVEEGGKAEAPGQEKDAAGKEGGKNGSKEDKGGKGSQPTSPGSFSEVYWKSKEPSWSPGAAGKDMDGRKVEPEKGGRRRGKEGKVGTGGMRREGRDPETPRAPRTPKAPRTPRGERVRLKIKRLERKCVGGKEGQAGGAGGPEGSQGSQERIWGTVSPR